MLAGSEMDGSEGREMGRVRKDGIHMMACYKAAMMATKQGGG